MSEHAERERRTKRYLERLAQQQEADEEIQSFDPAWDFFVRSGKADAAQDDYDCDLEAVKRMGLHK